jgi:hypothetical protein
VYRNRRRVLLVALVGVAAAGVYGVGVTSRLSPYRDTDPATQSAEATSRYEAVAGRQIDPGVVALVRTTAEKRVRQVERQLSTSPDVAAVSSYYDTHDPAMLSRDRQSTTSSRTFTRSPTRGSRTTRRGSSASSPAGTTSSSAARQSRQHRSTRRSATISRGRS